MGRVHHFLGLTVGVILPSMKPEQRREAYACDITYGTNNEFGFDYLRDNMASSLEECVQRGHHFAIVDEVDSILIDEARTPLIISGPAEDAIKWYDEFATHRARGLTARRRLRGRREEAHDRRPRAGHHQGRGPPRHRQPLRVGQHPADLLPQQRHQGQGAVTSTTRTTSSWTARSSSSTSITGRMLAGRRYNEGMHQAIEAKEGVEISEEYQTLATITLQNYFRLYEQALRHDRYGHDRGRRVRQDLQARRRARSRPTGDAPREDQHDLVYRTEEAKFDAVVDDIAERHEHGQPILVGTISVEKSEHLSSMLLRTRHPARGAQRQAPRRRGRDRRPGRAQGRGHRRHQHGRPRHRHHARRQRRVPRRPGAARQRASTRSRTPRSTRPRGPTRWSKATAAVAAEHDEVIERRRPLRAGHRAPRVAPHRQPAAWSLRPPGRPGRVAASTCRCRTT